MSITEYQHQRQFLYQKMRSRIVTANLLTRRLVSFQANKLLPFYRWFKYKEGFSAQLVSFFLEKLHNKPGKLLDPFAGMGTTLFTGQELGWQSIGIELLPVGAFVIKAREAANHVSRQEIQKTVQHIFSKMPTVDLPNTLKHIATTKDAFLPETEEQINRYISVCSSLKEGYLKTLLQFAAFSILEEISFTRKDGQFLRWDYRSKRDLSGKPFDKGKIYTFDEAFQNKIEMILDDISETRTSLFENAKLTAKHSPIQLIEGTCLEKLPSMEDNSFDFIMTSPPYCNRYDYTRTYALELVYLGKNQDDVRNLRQALLSCTVENKDKKDFLKAVYKTHDKEKWFNRIHKIYESNPAMKEVNAVLDELNRLELLNNKSVSRMVKNYFYEMCFVIAEMSRLLKRKGYCVMVNDNVRYGGEEIPVDLILSSFAEDFGFEVKQIYVLPQGKGNSSQQMGTYGKTDLRKCVYLWQKK
ncbi:MAG: site-specific DNA-methyltransferase [Planctomycetaceae bacterium]|jgi:DNA modification methylase|nr:site-specific DNA-methyltransferase [Planctomycetaceae bacterium]